MKVTLEFNLPEETEEMEMATRAQSMAVALSEVVNRVFRPARKHGYDDKEINDLLNELEGPGHELISLLEKKFHEILAEYDVSKFT